MCTCIVRVLYCHVGMLFVWVFPRGWVFKGKTGGGTGFLWLVQSTDIVKRVSWTRGGTLNVRLPYIYEGIRSYTYQSVVTQENYT